VQRRPDELFVAGLSLYQVEVIETADDLEVALDGGQQINLKKLVSVDRLSCGLRTFLDVIVDEALL
jgi:hypothetical protein